MFYEAGAVRSLVLCSALFGLPPVPVKRAPSLIALFRSINSLSQRGCLFIQAPVGPSSASSLFLSRWWNGKAPSSTDNGTPSLCSSCPRVCLSLLSLSLSLHLLFVEGKSTLSVLPLLFLPVWVGDAASHALSLPLSPNLLSFYHQRSFLLPPPSPLQPFRSLYMCMLTARDCTMHLIHSLRGSGMEG